MTFHVNSSSIATRQRVTEVAEAMLAEGYPIEKISQSAVRTRLGGGSMTTIHRHLKPLLEEKRACLGGRGTVVPEQPEHDPAHVPEAARHLLDGMKSSVDELGRVVVQLIDAAVTDERHRQELVRTKEQAEHRRVADDLQSVLDAVRYDLEQTADESAEYQEQLDTARARLDAMEAEVAELRTRAVELERHLQGAAARADAAEREAAQKDARIAVLEQEFHRSRDARASAEDRADRAEQRADDADKACKVANRRAHDAHTGWRDAEMARAQAEGRVKPARVIRGRRNGPRPRSAPDTRPAKGKPPRKLKRRSVAVI